jgi:hypothetical protein
MDHIKKIAVTTLIRASDLRCIRISCRCGERFANEVPRFVEYEMNFVNCPTCGRGFIMMNCQACKEWHIKALEGPSAHTKFGTMEGKMRPSDDILKEIGNIHANVKKENIN